ncbi:MAG: hypothetical protein JRN62_10165 [Nitrososphaerota archaeon]|nr:hypothetical protein [Nitrososphaerota archaeon]MDG6949829.1 hypothetical protein [Nitrososphaerota archaeon]
MPEQGWKSVSVKSELFERLEGLRGQLGFRSIAETIGWLYANRKIGEQEAKQE